jgi:hypothetical protein
MPALLDFPCGICGKRLRLTQLLGWAFAHPLCSNACRERASELGAPQPIEAYAQAAIAGLDACRPELEQALPLAHRAAMLHQRAEQLAAGSSMPNGVISLMAESGRQAAVESMQNEVRSNAFVISAHLFEVERRLCPAVCQAMGLHAHGIPTVPMLSPLAKLSILVVDPTRLDPRDAHGELDHLYRVLGALRGMIAETAFRR